MSLHLLTVECELTQLSHVVYLDYDSAIPTHSVAPADYKSFS